MFWVNLMDTNSSTHVDLKHNINQFLNELTLCTWVKANDNIKHGASIIHYGEGKDQYCDDIAITYHNSSSYEGFSFRILNKNARVNFSVLDGRPHHLCVTWEDSGLWNAFQDGKKVSNGTRLKTGQSIEPNGWLVIGQNINRQKISTGNYKCTRFTSKSLFVGGVSQVYLWNESLNSDLLYSFHNSCTVPEIDKLLFKWNVTNVGLRGSVFTQRFP